MNLTIAQKIFLSIAVILVFSFINGAYAVYTITKSANGAEVVATDLAQANTVMSRINFDNMYLQYTILGYTMMATQERYDTIYKLIDEIKKDLDTYEKYVKLPKTKTHSPKTVAEFAEYKQHMLDYLAIVDRNTQLLKQASVFEENFNKDRVTVLIDGNSVIYRAFYNVPPLTANGVPTGVIHVFLSVLEKLRKNPEISDIIIIFDAKGENRRHEMFESYKATRQAMPEDLITQLNILKEMLPYTGYPIYCIEGYEADDVINTLSQTINNRVWIVTKDKDLHQLVNDKVQIYDYQKDEVIDREKVYEKFGLYPESIPDMLALMGDTSDNIPGIAGIGPKTAKTLLDEYKNLDNIFENAENLKGKTKEKIIQGKDSAYLSRELVKLFFIEDMKPAHIERDEEKLKYYYELYQLKQQLASLNTAVQETASAALEYKPVNNAVIMAYLNDKIYAVDETSYYEYSESEPVYYYDIKSLIKKGINIPENAFDILLADYLMDPDAGGIRQLKDESEGEFFSKLYKKSTCGK